MPIPSKLKIATGRIIDYFDELQQRVFRTSDLNSILTRQRYEWKLARNTTTHKFIDFLLENAFLKRVPLTSEHYPTIERYVWREASPLSIALSLKRPSYLSHATAVFAHALTDQIPQTIYVNHEQSIKPNSAGPLTQQSLDRAFAHPQRRSNYIFHEGSSQFVILSGKNTGELGVISLPGHPSGSLRVTGIERTLIDIAVRPDYAGGVYQILQAYKSAREQMSVNVLMAQLKKLAYVYPFHQAIGFYMQKAGYEQARWERLRTLPMEFDFYLAHDIRDKDYDSSWRIFFPKGLE